MEKIHLTLVPEGSAARVADDIRNAGTVNYTDASGSTVTVTVGDVTVEGDVAPSQ